MDLDRIFNENFRKGKYMQNFYKQEITCTTMYSE